MNDATNDPIPARRTPWIRLLLLGVVTGLAFLEKPVHVDDIYHLAITDQIIQDPLRPYNENAKWIATNSFVATPHPPLLFYLYAITYSFRGWDVMSFHVVNALFQMALVLGVYRLASRCTIRPLLWSCAISMSPFIWPTNNLMLDIPVITCWVWAFELQMRALFDDRPRSAWLAGVAAGAGLLIKYHTGIMVLLMIYSCLRARNHRALVCIIPAGLIFTGWCVHNYFVYGIPHFIYHLTAKNLGPIKDPIDIRLRILLRGIGSVIWVTPVLFLALMRKNVWNLLLMISLLALACYVGYWDRNSAAAVLAESRVIVSDLYGAHFLVFAGNGVLALICLLWAIERQRRKQDSRESLLSEFFLIWAVAGLAFNLFALPKVPFGAIRHMQLFLIPLLIAAAPTVDQWIRRSSRKWVFTWICVLGSSALGFALSAADQITAFAYQSIANENIGKLKQSGSKVWFSGEPSFRYYGEAAGGIFWKPSDQMPTPPLRPGDTLVLPFLQNRELVRQVQSQNAFKIDRSQITSELWLRTISDHANFYGGHAINLPWEFACTVSSAPGKPTIYWFPPIEDVFVFSIP